MPIGTDRNIMGESALPLAAVMPSLGAQDAVANMQKMMQSGFITADDIATRASARESMKADLDIRAMQEAKAMAPKLAELKKRQTEEALAESKYGPGIKLFQTLAPVAGLSQIPTLPDGSTDYATMAQQGGQMAAWAAERQKAQEELIPVPSLSVTVTGEGPDYQQHQVTFNKFGQQLTGEFKQNALQRMTRTFSDFSGMAPGTVSTGPAKPAPSGVGRITPAPTTAPLPAEAVQPARTDDSGFPIGSNAQMKMQDAKAATDRAKTVSDTQQALNNAKEMSGNIAEGLAIVNRPGAPVGALPGSEIGQLFYRLKAMVGGSPQSYSEQDKLRGLIGKKVLEGAQQMKGNLSDKDVRFLTASYPSLGSTQERWVSYLKTWQMMNEANQRVLADLSANNGVSKLKGASILTGTLAVPKDSQDLDPGGEIIFGKQGAGTVLAPTSASAAAAGATAATPPAPSFAKWGDVPPEALAQAQAAGTRLIVGGIPFDPPKN